jgi:cytochrome c553
MKTAAEMSAISAVVAAMALLFPGPVCASEEKADVLTQTALHMDAHPDAGREQFERACSTCHGRRGEGEDGRQVPALAGQRFDYLVRQMADFGAAERDDVPMHHVAAETRLQDPQSWADVAAYLNRLPAPAAAKTGDGASVALGRGIFHEQCASCHRADAAGDKEGFVPSLRNQNYQYLVGQLHRMAESHRHNVDRNLMLLIRSLDDADIVAVADYLSRRRGVVRAHDHMLGNGVVVN